MKRQAKNHSRIAHYIATAIKYITVDMWRITGRDIPTRRYFFINTLKTVYISIKHFVACDLYKKASALTFSTLLAVIPMLAILFAIGKGFGFQNIIQSQLFDYFPSNREALTHALNFIEAYLNETKSGVFVGIGLIYLLWTVIGLISNVEDVMNEIWGVKKNRSIYRQITDYTWVFLLLPVVMVSSSGISIFITTTIDNSNYLHFISPLVRNLISFSPFFLSSILFTIVYALVPNTRVQLRYALLAGVLCGVAFQGFQYLYLNGQIWVSRYNAIYGSFAFLPLLLLWINLSWAICLFGAVFTYSLQNIQIYNFANETENISRRYKDFVALVITTIVVKRFSQGLTPLTVTELSNQYGIPLRLANEVTYRLLEIGVISEVVTSDDRVSAYQPAQDINAITAGMVLARLDQEGEEDFTIDREDSYREEWQCIIGCKEAMYSVGNNVLLKDLDCAVNID